MIKRSVCAQNLSHGVEPGRRAAVAAWAKVRQFWKGARAVDLYRSPQFYRQFLREQPSIEVRVAAAAVARSDETGPNPAAKLRWNALADSFAELACVAPLPVRPVFMHCRAVARVYQMGAVRMGRGMRAKRRKRVCGAHSLVIHLLSRAMSRAIREGESWGRASAPRVSVDKASETPLTWAFIAASARGSAGTASTGVYDAVSTNVVETDLHADGGAYILSPSAAADIPRASIALRHKSMSTTSSSSRATTTNASGALGFPDSNCFESVSCALFSLVHSFSTSWSLLESTLIPTRPSLAPTDAELPKVTKPSLLLVSLEPCRGSVSLLRSPIGSQSAAHAVEGAATDIFGVSGSGGALMMKPLESKRLRCCLEDSSMGIMCTGLVPSALESPFIS